MPLMNLGQIMSYASTLAGGRLDWTQSEASFWVNLAASEVGNVIYHSGKEALAISSTTSGENRIAPPTDYDYGIALSNLSTWGVEGGRQLRKAEAQWIDSQGTTFGEPEVWADYGTWVELWPTPDSAYSMQLRYLTKTPTLVYSTDTLPFDERWHQGVLFKTAELFAASRDNPEAELLARNRYVNYMSSVPNDQSKRQHAKTGMAMRLQTKED